MAFVGDLKWRQHFDYAISRIRLHDNIPDGILSNAIYTQYANIPNAKIPNANIPNYNNNNNHFDATFDKECSFYVQRRIGKA